MHLNKLRPSAMQLPNLLLGEPLLPALHYLRIYAVTALWWVNTGAEAEVVRSEIGDVVE